VRYTDVNSIEKSITLFHERFQKYPEPDNAVNITFSGALVWKQGTVGESTFRQVGILSKIPVDPQTNTQYTHSLLEGKKQFQIGAIEESNQLSSLP